MLQNEHGYNMASYEILPLFGLPRSSPIPPKYADAKVIDGVLVMILPRGAAPIKRRVVAQCPKCAQLVCAGHLHQHMKVHKKK